MDDIKLIELAIKTAKQITGNDYYLFEYSINYYFSLKHVSEVITFAICYSRNGKHLRIVNATNLTDNIAVKFNEKGIKTF